MDSILSVWNINSIYHPQFIFRGHKENITDFVFNELDGYVITASKDSSVILQSFDESYHYHNFTNKNPLNFDIENNLFFRSEFSKKKTVFKDLKETKNLDRPCIYNLKDQYLTPIYFLNGENKFFILITH